MSQTHHNLLADGPEPTRLPTDAAAEALESGTDPVEVAAAHPASSLAWAVLAEQRLAADEVVVAYAFARTGYHRGLDALRRSGWRGSGPVPYAHVPNQGFLRALAALAIAADRIGEVDEAERCTQFLRDSSEEAWQALLAPGA
ncbi:MAG TPA: DUF3151 domain-containing protein [Candidatus Avipropionibacterium avicola]|uniref:DUF3151 domain-containing protein n=1 Tax=Candidatus Avipropionibacterium avicola TaxID=2840701 RepID=A0A9D1GVD2_9ACTN|nr:DUF3151 domain-containing protein [Candidatus Avipropionibacterium avicola]